MSLKITTKELQLIEFDFEHIPAAISVSNVFIIRHR